MNDQAVAAQVGIELSVKDRLVLLGILMGESGRLADYKIIAALRDRLALSEHEQERAEFIGRVGQVLLVVPLLAKVDLAIFQRIHNDSNKQRHTLQLVVFPFQLGILLLEIFRFDFEVKERCLELVEL